ncbi:ABC transporter permease [Coleofasciculus chthonoplastes]|uniref:ABC transporter permease n=1 Tax=Coleofasciculus chthonoplastes TaxID=64178 RepID=UPI0032FBEDD6
MDIVESIKMASTTLMANKLRSSLTMLGIIIGNASVIAMVGIGQGAQKLASEQFEALSPHVLFVIPGSREAQQTTFDLPKTLVWEDAKAIATQVPAVAEVAPEINLRYLITYRNRNSNSLVTGTTPEFPSVRSFNVARGRFFTNLDIKRNNQVAVLGSEVVEKMFGYQDPIGQSVRIKDIRFEVIGVMEPKGTLFGNNLDDVVFIPLSTMANRLRGRTSPYGVQVSWIAVAAKDRESISAAKFQIENLLRRRHKIVGEDDFGVEIPENFLQIVNAVTGALTIMLAAIAAISLVVGGIGVMNIMLVSVRERTQEIGLRKAVGAREQDILIQFMIEAIILSAAGGIIGTAIGVSGVLLVGAFSPLKAGISPIAILVAVGVSGGIGLFFGVVPARQAAKLNPIVALRSA